MLLFYDSDISLFCGSLYQGSLIEGTLDEEENVFVRI